MTTRVWLIRHGEPEPHIRGRCYGSLDVALSPVGRNQMEQVARELKTEPLAAIYSSPQLRAKESARMVASHHSCDCEANPGLRELNFGDFEGRTYDEIAVLYPDLYRQWMDAPTTIPFPNGESFPEMRARVLEALKAILHQRDGQTVAIVTHGGVIRIAIAWVLDMPDQCLFRLAQDYAAMNLVIWVDGIPRVESLNHKSFTKSLL
jgi:alpha-ribazole phosphatase